MKLIVKQYLQSLRERKELDAILPTILSEIGLVVITTPSIGTRQYGVDIAAVGNLQKDSDVKKLYLFSLKAGDLTRSDWDNSDQAIRPSLNEIRDVYLNSYVPTEFIELDVVICVCMGGELTEAVLPNWAAYTKAYETERVSFELWNGDKLADLLIQSMLGREILGKDLQNDFQKSLAMLDQPDISYNYFRDLLRKLLIEAVFHNHKERLQALRQAYMCLWIVYVWARDIDNYEAPYRISELTLLNAWHITKNIKHPKTKQDKEVFSAIDEFLLLHLDISGSFLENKIYANSSNLHALSRAVNSQSSVDINLAMFETIGRIAMHGIWWKHLMSFSRKYDGAENFALHCEKQANVAFNNGVQIINNNPILLSPIKDEQMIEICLFTFLAQYVNQLDSVKGWLVEIANRTSFSLMTRGRFPTSNSDYRDIINHPKDESDEYMEETSKGSILYPFLAVWLHLVNADETWSELHQEIECNIPKCTMQVWFPDEETDSCLWKGDKYHGKVITGLNMDADTSSLIRLLDTAIKDNTEYQDISAVSIGLFPLLLLACKHFKMPVPPQQWVFRPIEGTDQRHKHKSA